MNRQHLIGKAKHKTMKNRKEVEEIKKKRIIISFSFFFLLPHSVTDYLILTGLCHVTLTIQSLPTFHKRNQKMPKTSKDWKQILPFFFSLLFIPTIKHKSKFFLSFTFFILIASRQVTKEEEKNAQEKKTHHFHHFHSSAQHTNLHLVL